jgi:hypothetical protein
MEYLEFKKNIEERIFNLEIKDNSINKSNRLTVLDLKTSDIKSIYDEAKSLKSRIQNLCDKEKERLWTLRALKKSVI